MSLTVSLHLKSVLLSTSAHTATMQSGIRKVKLYPLKEEGRIALHFTVSLSFSLSLSLPLSLQHSSARIVPVHVTTIANVTCPQTVGPSVSLGAGDNS